MKKITIVDYGVGNILSISRAVEEVGFNTELTNNHNKILGSDLLILPGVGAFENAMELLKKNGLVETLNEFVKLKKPLIGICLGMQMLLTKSFEMGEHKGLDFIPGEVIKIDNMSDKNKVKIPHINWTEIFIKSKLNSNILTKNLENRSFYFIHSFMSLTKNENHTIAYAKYYDLEIPAIIKRENVVGFQFHPEKSGKNGLKLLKNVLKIL